MLPDVAKALSSLCITINLDNYTGILQIVLSLYRACWINWDKISRGVGVNVVSSAAVIWVVKRCVTTKITAAEGV